MSAPINDGGPAFPVPNDANVNSQAGMSLRDYFAGHALAGVLSDSTWQLCDMDRVSARCYAAADAMIKAREVTK